MKNSMIKLCFMLLSFQAFATIRTVSNTPGTLAQYSGIQAAINASASGDTVYIHGSGTGYAGATIQDKSLTLIGPGWSPTTSPSAKAFVGSIHISGNSNNTMIQGLYLAGNNQNPNNGGIGIFLSNDLNGISLIRNTFTGNASIYLPCPGGTMTNFLIEGNYFVNSTIGVQHNCFGTGPIFFSDVLVTNNVFIGNARFPLLQYATNVVFDHNLFYGSDAGYSPFAGNYLLIKNNVFVGRNFSSTDYSTFENNITYNTTGNNPPWTYSNNNGTGNIDNTNPQMVDQTEVNNGTFNLLLDFTISSGAANNAGTDGKDLGLLFDPSGYLNWTHSGNSKLPVITQLSINSTVNPGGNLEIHLNASQAK